jgi:hypothetical protein
VALPVAYPRDQRSGRRRRLHRQRGSRTAAARWVTATGARACAGARRRVKLGRPARPSRPRRAVGRGEPVSLALDRDSRRRDWAVESKRSRCRWLRAALAVRRRGRAGSRPARRRVREMRRNRAG